MTVTLITADGLHAEIQLPNRAEPPLDVYLPIISRAEFFASWGRDPQPVPYAPPEARRYRREGRRTERPERWIYREEVSL